MADFFFKVPSNCLKTFLQLNSIIVALKRWSKVFVSQFILCVAYSFGIKKKKIFSPFAGQEVPEATSPIAVTFSLWITTFLLISFVVLVFILHLEEYCCSHPSLRSVLWCKWFPVHSNAKCVMVTPEVSGEAVVSPVLFTGQLKSWLNPKSL